MLTSVEFIHKCLPSRVISSHAYHSEMVMYLNEDIQQYNTLKVLLDLTLLECNSIKKNWKLMNKLPYFKLYGTSSLSPPKVLWRTKISCGLKCDTKKRPQLHKNPIDFLLRSPETETQIYFMGPCFRS